MDLRQQFNKEGNEKIITSSELIFLVICLPFLNRAVAKNGKWRGKRYYRENKIRSEFYVIRPGKYKGFGIIIIAKNFSMKTIYESSLLNINEYLLVLMPDGDLSERIMKLRDRIQTECKMSLAPSTRPHITLAIIRQRSMMEERLIRRLQAACMELAPIKVELKDFGSLPSHSIYINVTSKVPIQTIVAGINKAQSRFRMEEDKPHYFEDPHILICNKLKPWQYERAWLQCSNTFFSGRFIADGVHLLKRATGQKKFTVIKKFLFLNQSVKTEQGNLFD